MNFKSRRMQIAPIIKLNTGIISEKLFETGQYKYVIKPHYQRAQYNQGPDFPSF